MGIFWLSPGKGEMLVARKGTGKREEVMSNLEDKNRKESPRIWQSQHLPVCYVYISIIHSFILKFSEHLLWPDAALGAGDTAGNQRQNFPNSGSFNSRRREILSTYKYGQSGGHLPSALPHRQGTGGVEKQSPWPMVRWQHVSESWFKSRLIPKPVQLMRTCFHHHWLP